MKPELSSEETSRVTNEITAAGDVEWSRIEIAMKNFDAAVVSGDRQEMFESAGRMVTIFESASMKYNSMGQGIPENMPDADRVKIKKYCDDMATGCYVFRGAMNSYREYLETGKPSSMEEYKSGIARAAGIIAGAMAGEK